MKRRFLLLGFFVFLLGSLAACAYALLTPEGGWAVCSWVLRRRLACAEVKASGVEGSLWGGLRLHQMEVRGLAGVPGGSVQARFLAVQFHPRDLLHPSFLVHDVRIRLPESGPIHLSGRLSEGRLNFNLYAPVLDLQKALAPFLSARDRARVSGELREVDLKVLGSAGSPQVTGTFRVVRFRFVSLHLRECPVAVALRTRLRGAAPALHGEALFKQGQLEFKRSSVELHPSRLLFSGDPKLPTYDLHGATRVEKIPIRITLKGNFRRPDLRLSSDPPLPQEHLLLMLVTGKRWKGMEGTGQGGQLPLDLVADFIDYAALGGTGGQMARRLGLEGSFVLTEDGRTRGLGVRKSITPSIGVRYGLEQTQPDYQGQLPITRQKVGAEVDVTATDQISLEAERDLPQPVGSEDLQTIESGEPADSKVLLKYRKRF